MPGFCRQRRSLLFGAYDTCHSDCAYSLFYDEKHRCFDDCAGRFGGYSLIVYFIDSSLYEGLISGLLTKLALFGQLKSFVDGKFDFTVVVYYVSSAFLFGFLTVRSVDKRRWN